MIPHRPAFGLGLFAVKVQRCFRKNSGGRVEEECSLDSNHTGS